MRKYTRQRIILELVESMEIETQEELLKHLLDEEIDITQATISRDIKELRLIKVLAGSGKYKYTTIDNEDEGANHRLTSIFQSSVLSIGEAENIVVVKTLPGAAKICASALDNFKIEGVVGTVSGDNTIFIAISGIDMMEPVMNSIQKLLK